jgi:hypothetical protein
VMQQSIRLRNILGNDICQICGEDFSEASLRAIMLCCGHKFHRICIEGHLESYKTCPVCKKRVDNEGMNDGHSADIHLIHSSHIPPLPPYQL